MITCPWCGTTYAAFQSNCKNCGGPLPAPSPTDQPVERLAPRVEVLMPPPPPRPISDRYVWRIMLADPWSIAMGIFGLLGAIFTFIGGGLTVAIITAFVGIPFLILGLIFLGFSIPILRSRQREATETVLVLRLGEAVQGTITKVEQNYNLRVNHRHPWIITYQFLLNGQAYTGTTSTLADLGPQLQAGQPACILYRPGAPEKNTLYPRP